jgi:hypothetical protein
LTNPSWKGTFFQVERGPHLLQSCLRVAQDGLAPTVREMHLCFESLAIISALSLRASLMDIHHDTSFKFILEDDSISLAFKTYIHSCLGKTEGYGWLFNHLSIHSHILFSPHICIFVSI